MNNDPELFNDFIKAVRDMRSKQQAYFLNRTQMTLILAKNAEKVVDAWLNHYSEVKLIQSSRAFQDGLFKQEKP
jgi:hypothetical protein